MLLTLLGIVMDFKLWQRLKVLSFILFTLSGIVIDVS